MERVIRPGEWRHWVYRFAYYHLEEKERPTKVHCFRLGFDAASKLGVLLLLGVLIWWLCKSLGEYSWARWFDGAPIPVLAALLGAAEALVIVALVAAAGLFGVSVFMAVLWLCNLLTCPSPLVPLWRRVRERFKKFCPVYKIT